MDAFVPIFAATLALSGSIMFIFVGPKIWDHFYNRNERSLKELRELKEALLLSEDYKESLAEITKYRQEKWLAKVKREYDNDLLREKLELDKAKGKIPRNSEQKRAFTDLKKDVRKLDIQGNRKAWLACGAIFCAIAVMAVISGYIAKFVAWIWGM